ncbi:MAG: bifunctional metallophosphatase/5'-nucleotidase [Myxococcales bacterium]
MRVLVATFLLIAASHAPAKSARIARLTVVGINDVHGALLEAPPHNALARYTAEPVGGADWFAGWVAAIRSDAREHGGEAIVLDAGDEFQGTLISNQFEGRSVVDVFNRIGITAAAVGNHEFDFGLDALKARFSQASYPFLCANVFEKGTRKRPSWARPSALVNVGGVQVGVVGLTTVETHTSTNPAIISGLEFVPGGPVAAQEADALRARGATIVLLVAHVGPLPPSQEIQQVAEAVRGKVDAIVSGHNHIAIGPPPLVAAGIPVVQSGSKLAAFSIIEISIDPATGRAAGFAVNDGTYPRPGGPQPIFHGFEGRPAAWRGQQIHPDAGVAGILAKYDDQVKRLREAPVGETLVDLRKSGREGSLGNLVADALRSGAGGSLPADFALTNAGGLRIEEVRKGPIRFGTLFDLYPFDNRQVVVTVHPVELRDGLEAVLRAGKRPLYVSGLHYTIEWDRYAAGKEVRKVPAGGLITSISDSEGKLLCSTRSCTATACDSICDSRTYTVSTSDFLANGGDGLALPGGARRVEGTVLTRDIVVSYVKQHSPITAEMVSSAAARVTVVGRRERQEIP